MPRPRQVEPAAIALRLQVGGPQPAQALATALRVDRSSISRALALPALAPQVVRLGTTRGATYALRRPVRGLGDSFPIRCVDAEGRVRDWAELVTLHGGWQLNWAEPDRAPAWAAEWLGLGGFTDGFPFFLGEARPQGYLGRAVGRALSPTLNLPADLRNWSDDDTLVYLQAEGDDLPGDLIVGDAPLRRAQERALNPPRPLSEAERAERYPALAAASVESGTPGSSVEGEQPKFLVTLGAGAAVTPVIVKFTDVISTPTGRRWADLLAAESQALALLHAHGEAHAAPRLLDAAGRRFLETPRYDRMGARGRRGVVSLRALHEAFGGPDPNTWPVAVANLHARGLIDAATLRSVRLRHAFGTLIGNSDMHFGNLAFFLGDTLPLRLAPGYDMLPMLWAPVPGQATPAPTFAPAPPLPVELSEWNEAAAWATEFWARVLGDVRVSAEFAGHARAAGAQVARMREVFG